ncbi:hypothetical protein [Erythrobacter sp.]|uniref:hypothetical protein n=1 Tax=Erythrobacter sp. TaxID=1042 RepID=UPI003C730793
MLVDRRRGEFPADLLIKTAIAWIAISAFLLFSRWNTGAIEQFADPDDILRLMQVRDLLAGQSWFDTTQYRIDAPGGGVPMHWSRLVDLPIAAVILLLTPFIGSGAAENAAVIIVPLLTLGVVLLLAMRIAWRLMGDEEATMTALVLAFSMPVLFQLIPTRIDHHGWQIVCALAALNGLMARSPQTGGRVIGAALAIWLSISIEGLPLAALFFVVLALKWLSKRDDRVMILSAIRTLAVTSLALFLATRGPFDLATYCDAISPVHLAIFGGGAIALSALSRLEPVPTAWILAGMAVTGAVAAGAMLGVAPQCVTSGGFDGLDPLVVTFWHEKVLEGRPFWDQNIYNTLQHSVAPLIGLFALFGLMRQSGGWLAQFWRDYAIILLGAYVISLFVLRAGAVACALAAPAVAWQLRQWLRSMRTTKRPMPRIAATLSILVALVPTLPLVLLAKAVPAAADTSVAGAASEVARTSNCKLEEATSFLDAYEPGEIFAPLDISPGLLFTRHSVVATGHHRGKDTMRLVIATSLGSTENARKVLLARGTDYIAVCPRFLETALYRQEAPESFIADLEDERAMDWLEPIEVDNGSNLMLWRVTGD